MGLRDGAYVRLWSAKDNGKVITCQASVSKKEDGGGYRTLFSGFVNFIGEECKEKIRSLGLPETSDRQNPVGKTIKVVGSPDVTTWFNPKTKENRMNIAVYDVELQEDGGNQKQSKSAPKTYRKKAEPKPAEDEDDDSELPF